MFCPICGTIIEKDGVFCPACGTRVENESPVQQTTYAPAPQPAYAPAPQPAYAPAPQPVYAPAPQPVYAPQPMYAPAPQPAYAPPVVDEEYAKIRGTAITAMVLAIISAFAIPWFMSLIILIFACVSRKKLKALKGCELYGAAKACATVAKAVSTFSFIYGLIGTIIWGILIVIPLLFYTLYVIVMIIALLAVGVSGGF